MLSGPENGSGAPEKLSDRTRTEIELLADRIVRSVGFQVSFETETGKNPRLAQLIPQLEASGYSMDSVLAETAKGELAMVSFRPFFLEIETPPVTLTEITVRVARAEFMHIRGLVVGYRYLDQSDKPANYLASFPPDEAATWSFGHNGLHDHIHLTETEGRAIFTDLESLFSNTH